MATVTYSDQEIATLIQERKPLPKNWRSRLIPKVKRVHKEEPLGLTGDAGSTFRVILRQNLLVPLDFSVILAVQVPRSNQMFRLRRYNGGHHEHTNNIEQVTFVGFHIHYATERYQAADRVRDDGYAALTTRYSDINGALQMNCRCKF